MYLLNPAGLSCSEKQSLRSTSVIVGKTWSLKCSITRLVKTENLRQTWSSLKQEMLISLCAHKLGLSIRGSDFIKITRVSSRWLWLESSHSVKNVTRVESPSFSTWLESSPSHRKSWIESRRVISDSSHAITDSKHEKLSLVFCPDFHQIKNFGPPPPTPVIRAEGLVFASASG